MEDIARGVLAGVAIGGFAAVVVKVNMFTIDKLSMLNNLAIETAFNIGRTTLENIKMRRRERKRLQGIATFKELQQHQILESVANEQLHQQADAVGVQL